MVPVQIDQTVKSFVVAYEKKNPNSKFSFLLYSQQKQLASYYCRFVWACNILKERGVVNLADIKGFNAIAENALNSCNSKKLKKVANKVCGLVK